MADRNEALTPVALRQIADWLDTYDRMATQYIEFCRLWRLGTPKVLDAALAIVDGDTMQRDLRRWADEMDSPCTCGYGGFHEPLNTRCDRNQVSLPCTEVQP